MHIANRSGFRKKVNTELPAARFELETSRTAVRLANHYKNNATRPKNLNSVDASVLSYCCL